MNQTSNKGKFIYGFKHLFIARYSRIFIQILISAILARLLTPQDFGKVAMILVFSNFFGYIGNSIGPSIIQYKSLTNNNINGIFIFSLILGIISSIIFIILSKYFFVRFYDDPVFFIIGLKLTVLVFLKVPRFVPEAILRKNNNYRNISSTMIFANIFTGFLAILLAYLGYGYDALIYKAIVNEFIIFLMLSYFAKFKKLLVFNFNGIRIVFNYFKYQLLFNIINFFSRKLDKILIGKYLGEESLGYYDRAYRLVLFPIENLTRIISPVLHPILSGYQDDYKYIIDKHKKLSQIVFVIGALISLISYYNAKEIITILYGNQWENTIPIFRILSLSIMFQTIHSFSGSIFKSVNNTKNLFISGLIGTFLIILGITIGVYFNSSLLVAKLILVTFILYFFITFYILYNLTLNSNIKNYLKALLPTGLNFMLSFILVGALMHFLSFTDYLIVNLILKSLIIISIFLFGSIINGDFKFVKYFIKNRK